MDEAHEIFDYLPVYLRAPSEQEYISFLRTVFEESYTGEKFHFAYLAYHMLVMSFVYFSIWQIRETYSDDFEKGLIGFGERNERILKSPSPFAFSEVHESAILGLFRLIGCDNSQIGNYRTMVKYRNDAAHANGNISFKTQREMDIRIRAALSAIREIQTHSQSVINRCYAEFLLQSYDPDERQYPDAEDQIREALIHDNYMSRKDIEICVNFDISSLGDENADAIKTLHDALREIYG